MHFFNPFLHTLKRQDHWGNQTDRHSQGLCEPQPLLQTSAKAKGLARSLRHQHNNSDSSANPSNIIIISEPRKVSTERFRKPLLQFCIIFKVFRIAFAILSRAKVLLSRNACLHNSLSRSFRVDDSCSSAYKLSRSFRGKWLRMDLRLCFRAAFARWVLAFASTCEFTVSF